MITENTELMPSSKTALCPSPSTSAVALPVFSASDQSRHLISTGKKVTATAIITNTPKPDLSMEILPDTVL